MNRNPWPRSKQRPTSANKLKELNHEHQTHPFPFRSLAAKRLCHRQIWRCVYTWSSAPDTDLQGRCDRTDQQGTYRRHAKPSRYGSRYYRWGYRR
jgi:hypothetical protein